MSEINTQVGIHEYRPIQFQTSDFVQWDDGVRPVSLDTIATLGAGRHTVILRHVDEETTAYYIGMKTLEADEQGLSLTLKGQRIRISRKDGAALTHEDLKIFNQFSTSGFEE